MAPKPRPRGRDTTPSPFSQDLERGGVAGSSPPPWLSWKSLHIPPPGASQEEEEEDDEQEQEQEQKQGSHADAASDDADASASASASAGRRETTAPPPRSRRRGLPRWSAAAEREHTEGRLREGSCFWLCVVAASALAGAGGSLLGRYVDRMVFGS